MKNYFKSLDNGLTDIADYIDLRIRTGKFTQDIPVVSRIISENTKERTAYYWNIFYNSGPTQFIVLKLQKIYRSLMKISPLGNFITISLDALKVLSWGLIEASVAVAVAFFSVFLCVSLFQNSPVSFFIFLPFIFLANLFMFSLFYLYVDKKLKHEAVNWLKAIQEVSQRFISLSLLLSYHLSLIIGATIFFLIASLYYSYFFDFLSIEWGKSFYYWVLVIFLAITIAFFIFIMNILFLQSYYFMLLEKKSAFQSFGLSIKFYRTFPLQLFSFNFFLLIVGGFFGVWAISNYYYLGVGLTLLFCWGVTLFYNYLLRRKYIERTIPSIEEGLSKYKILFLFIPLIGFSTYILSSAFIMQHYREIDRLFIEEQATQFKTFENTEFGYSINYPNEWTEYHTEYNLVTLYNNDTGTKAGGIWITIATSPLSENFDVLFKSKPGLVYYETVTNNVTTKVTNLAIDGHSAVQFTYIKNDVSYTEYQTHYLVRKNDREYDIVITTINKGVEDRNTELFKQIISSFRFTDN